MTRRGMPSSTWAAMALVGACLSFGCGAKPAEAPPTVVVTGIWQAHLGTERRPELFAELATQGFRLLDVSGYTLGGEERYASVWLFGDGRGWQELHGVDQETLLKTNAAHAKSGLTLAHVSGFETSKGARYAAIWEPDADGTVVDLRVDLTGDALAKSDAEPRDPPVRLVDVSAFGTDDGPRFTAAWSPLPQGQPKTELSIDLDAAALDALVDDAAAKGARLVRLGGYEVDGEARFYALRVVAPGPFWMARRDLTATTYQTTLEDMVQIGYRISHLSAYTVKGAARYAAVFTR
jgi:hypothetical protein